MNKKRKRSDEEETLSRTRSGATTRSECKKTGTQPHQAVSPKKRKTDENEPNDSMKDNVNAVPKSDDTKARPQRSTRNRRNEESKDDSKTRKHNLPNNKDSKEDTNDVKVVHSTEQNTLTFKPVNKEWQKKICENFDLKPVKFHESVTTKDIGISAGPKSTVKIQGDGNCYFRTISYMITGEENKHKHIRDLVVRYLERNEDIFRTIHDSQDYINESCMNNLGQWATEVEIIATASMLATDIYVYCSSGKSNKWLRYGSLRGAERVIERSRQKMYISNLNEHFVPVIGM